MIKEYGWNVLQYWQNWKIVTIMFSPLESDFFEISHSVPCYLLGEGNCFLSMIIYQEFFKKRVRFSVCNYLQMWLLSRNLRYIGGNSVLPILLSYPGEQNFQILRSFEGLINNNFTTNLFKINCINSKVFLRVYWKYVLLVHSNLWKCLSLY